MSRKRKCIIPEPTTEIKTIDVALVTKKHTVTYYDHSEMSTFVLIATDTDYRFIDTERLTDSNNPLATSVSGITIESAIRNAITAGFKVYTDFSLPDALADTTGVQSE